MKFFDKLKDFFGKLKDFFGKLKDFFGKAVRKKLTVDFFIGTGVLLLSVVSLIIYLIYATSDSKLMMPWVVVFLALAIAGEVGFLVFDNDYLPVAIAMCPMAALGFFALSPPETLGSIVDRMQGGMVMFGDPKNFEIIIAVMALLLITAVVAITACFFKKTVKPET